VSRASQHSEGAPSVSVNVEPFVSEFDLAPTLAVLGDEIEWPHGSLRVIVRGIADAQILCTIIFEIPE
jgi:hypothetical protein